MKNFKIRKKGVGMRLGLKDIYHLRGRVFEKGGELMYIAQVDIYCRNGYDVTVYVITEGYKSLYSRLTWLDEDTETWIGEIVDQNGCAVNELVIPANVLIN